MIARKGAVGTVMLACLLGMACRPTLHLVVPAGRNILETYIGDYPAPGDRIVFSHRPMMDVLAQLGAVARKKYIHFVGKVNPYDTHILGSGTSSTELSLERLFYYLSDEVPYRLYAVADTIVVENCGEHMAK